jgi:hypothetical protein
MECFDQGIMNKLIDKSPLLYGYLRKNKYLNENGLRPLYLTPAQRQYISESQSPEINPIKNAIFKLDSLQKKQLEIEMLLRSIQNSDPSVLNITQGFLENVTDQQRDLYFILQNLINRVKSEDENREPKALNIQLCIYTLNEDVEPHIARESLLDVLEKMANKDTNRLRDHMVIIYPLPRPDPLSDALWGFRGPFMHVEQRLVKELRRYNLAKQLVDDLTRHEYYRYTENMKRKGHWKEHSSSSSSSSKVSRPLGPEPEPGPGPGWRVLGSVGRGVGSGLESVKTGVGRGVGWIVNKFKGPIIDQKGRSVSPPNGGKSKRVNRVKRSKCKRSSTKRRK